jgi:hypothetical protein
MLWQRKEVQRIVGAVTLSPPAHFLVITSNYMASGDTNIGSGNHVINCTGYKRFGLVDEGHRVLERNATASGQRESPGSFVSPSMGLLSVASV